MKNGKGNTFSQLKAALASPWFPLLKLVMESKSVSGFNALKYFDDEGKLSFTFIIKKLKSRMEIVVTFLAVLDLVREGICKLRQVDVFGEIELIHLQIKS